MKPLALVMPLALVLFTGCDSKKSATTDMYVAAKAEADAEAFKISEAPQFNTETYDRIHENTFLDAKQNPLSTFSIDVDTASYANVRRFLTQGRLPPADAVRIEELVNYFAYDYSPPDGDDAFSVHTEVAACPWAEQHLLARIALRGRDVALDARPNSNLVFLIDVSGSMDEPNKLPLVQAGLKLLVEQLTENDRVAIVVYAGSSGLVLPATTGDQQQRISAAIDSLRAGGSTNGAAGIELAYQLAEQNFKKGGTNRVILATDGDFNVGVTSQGELTRLIERKAKGGVFLSVLGFGHGNYKDSTMEKLADQGNGNYAYIDTINEARKVFIEQMTGTLITIAKDVKIQVEFNPGKIAAYRLIGYENRLMRAEDFRDDAKDAGEIGAGHTVTALYELVPRDVDVSLATVEPLKYQPTSTDNSAVESNDLFTVKLRYKLPETETSQPLEIVETNAGETFAQASGEFQFAAAVAGFGMLLRDSQHKGNLTFDGVREIAEQHVGADKQGHRAEFVKLVSQAKALQR